MCKVVGTRHRSECKERGVEKPALGHSCTMHPAPSQVGKGLFSPFSQSGSIHTSLFAFVPTSILEGKTYTLPFPSPQKC